MRERGRGAGGRRVALQAAISLCKRRNRVSEGDIKGQRENGNFTSSHTFM